jgi:cis-3-alkyl-4-acyloxetan-2-one decarboxylase
MLVYIYLMQRTIEVSGTTVYLQGNEKQVIIFIHGWPDTHEIWSSQVDFFSRKYTCASFTLPGFLKGDDKAYSLNDIIEKIDEVAKLVSPEEKVILMLHDWGCIFGYEYVMRHPEKVAKVVAIDIGDAASEEFVKKLPLANKLMVFGYQFTLALAWLTKLDVIHLKMAEALKARSNLSNIHAGMGLPYAMKWLSVAGGLKVQPVNITCQVYYAYGTKKPFLFHTESWVEQLSARPECKVKAYESGHWVMVDRKDEFNQDTFDWLGE